MASILKTNTIKNLTETESVEVNDIRKKSDSYSSSEVYTKAESESLSKGYKNILINPSFDIWQRGTSFSSSGFTADRWYVDIGDGATATVEKVNLTNTAVDLVGTKNALRFSRTVAGSTRGGIAQRIDDVSTLAGKEVTISFRIRALSGSITPVISVTQDFGTGGSSDNVMSDISAGSAVSSSTWVERSATFTIDTIGANIVGSGGDFTEIEIAPTLTNSTFEIEVTNVQLEFGPVKTDLNKRPLELEYLLTGEPDDSNPLGASILATSLLGVGQTWQDVTASRSVGVTYTNSTGKPIEVVISVTSSQAGNFKIHGNIASDYGASNVSQNLSHIVKNGETYSLTGGNITYWSELR